MDRIQDVMRTYDGSGDVASWLTKLKLVTKLKKKDEDLANIIPLYLEGPAFDVYEQMDEGKKSDAEEVQKILLGAFAQNDLAAYDCFRQRTWTPGEVVDAYLADLRRLARLAKIESDALIIRAFICGLPADVSAQLRIVSGISSKKLPDILEQTRIMMSERIHGAMAAVGTDDRSRKKQQHGSRDSPDGKLHCHICGGNHLPRFCKEKRKVYCWKCGEEGHMSFPCSGNDRGKSHAPVAAPQK